MRRKEALKRLNSPFQGKIDTSNPARPSYCCVMNEVAAPIARLGREDAWPINKPTFRHKKIDRKTT